MIEVMVGKLNFLGCKMNFDINLIVLATAIYWLFETFHNDEESDE